MRIIAAISDTSGCGTVRIGQPANALMAHDPSITVAPIKKSHFTATPQGKIVSVSADFLAADLFVLQRPLIPLQFQLMQATQQAGVAVVVEIDDDLHSLHRDHVMKKTLKPIHLATLKSCAAHADLVTVSTKHLASRYAQHGRYAVLPNFVPRSYTEIPKVARATIPVVGWAGSLATHPTDLKATQGGVGAALANSEAIFRVIGRPDRVQQDLGLERPVDHAPWCPIADYPRELARFDVGIAPLANTPFNRGKSRLKPLEMASVGVPVVMSAVGEYRDLPFGLLASTKDEWQRAITRLISDSAYREDIAQQGRQTVKHLFVLEDNIDLWQNAYQRAIKNRGTV